MDKERIIYYKLKKKLPFSKIGDQATIIGDQLSINNINMPIEYANSEFFTPVTLKKHEEEIKKKFIDYIMKEYNLTRPEAIIKSKTFFIKKII